jgi:hypothetical protein
MGHRGVASHTSIDESNGLPYAPRRCTASRNHCARWRNALIRAGRYRRRSWHFHLNRALLAHGADHGLRWLRVPPPLALLDTLGARLAQSPVVHFAKRGAAWAFAHTITRASIWTSDAVAYIGSARFGSTGCHVVCDSR